jgi:SAM-dependent methyltransferase
MDQVYRRLLPEEIPWNVEEPPQPLVELVQAGKVRPCRAIDLGCGTGNYAIYLASEGFEVTGVDISPTAIRIARKNAEKRAVRCDFVAADVLGDLAQVEGTFDFAYDWGLLHHILPENRQRYVENVLGRLNDKGRYLSVCFSDKDTCFEGRGKYRDTSLGTVVYLSSEEELRELFEPFFFIKELKTIQIRGRSAAHLAIYAFMEKSGA